MKSLCGVVYTETGCCDKAPQHRCDMTNYYPKACKEVLNELEKKKAGGMLSKKNIGIIACIVVVLAKKL